MRRMLSPPPLGNSSESNNGDLETPCDPDGFVSVTEASHLAKVSDETVRSWYDSGEITGIRDSRGHRLIDRASLLRRLDSIGVSEAARLVDRSPYTVRQWFDRGFVEGHRTTTGRRRLSRSSLEEFTRLSAEHEVKARS